MTPDGVNVVWKNETICYTFPPKMSADGSLYERDIIDDLLSASLTLLNIQILIIFVISNSINCLLRRIRIPSFVGQALTGIILGPSMLGGTDFGSKKLFPHSSQDNLEVVAYIGYSTFMFLIGVRMDAMMVMNSGGKVLTIGLFTFILPLVFALGAQHSEISSADNKYMISQIFTVTGIQSLTTFAVVSHLLSELKLTNSEIGRVALSSSLISGSFGAFLQIISSTLASEFDLWRRLLNLAGFTFAFLVSIFVIRPALISLVVKRTRAGERVNPSWIFVIMGLATAYEVYFDFIRQSYILGPYMFGLLVVPPGPPLGSALVEVLETLSQAVLFPVFVAMTVMKANMNYLFVDFESKSYFVALIYWTTFLKFVVCLLLARPWMPALDSVVLSLILNAKGVVDISIHAYMRDTQSLPPTIYALFAFSIIINATVIPVIVSYLYEPSRRYANYHSRNIFALKAFTELRILTCIHKDHNVTSVMKLLDTLSRTEESAVGLYVIHLLEQIGHATPVFISHQRRKKPSSMVSDDSSISSSVDVIFAFSQYERKNCGFTSLQSFTSISQYKFMQEDIFMLALDKLVSLILIPFHLKWAIDGSIESEDNVLRALNTRILNTAPCSVGILFDRGGLIQHDNVVEEYTDKFSEAASLSSSRSVCMIYLGGRDDQEAISLAKRMANDPCVHLTIMHMISKETQSHDIEGNVVLKNVLQEIADHLNVHYMEKVVNDGTETAKVVSSVAGQYDLFVVGRRSDIDMDSPQTEGLANWSEFPELGVVGDLLASKDVHTRGSVLVVQQQKKLK
ncbi:Cation/H(+) antiporter 4 [Linum perenne]